MVTSPVRWRFFVATVICCLSGVGHLGAQVTVDLATGDAFNLRTPLTITQRGFPDIHVDDVRFLTHPFKSAPYFDLQVGFWRGTKGWIVGFLHHKLYWEEDVPPEIARFEMSNGFSILSLSRGWRLGHLILSAGGGAVIANPDVNIRGVGEREDAGFLHAVVGSGYYISGGSLLFAAQRNFPVVDHLHLALAAKVTGSYAGVPMPGGRATFRNVALHLHAGLGSSF